MKRKEFFEYFLKESLKLVKEADQAPGAEPAPEQPVAAAPPAATPEQPAPPTTGVGGQGEKPITIDSIIERLNVIRGGKSFSDPEVYGLLTTFFNNLTEEQKTTLNQLLMQIGQVVISALPTKKAPEQPAAPPAPEPAAPAPTPAAPEPTPPIAPTG